MHSDPLLWASYTQSFVAKRFDAVLHKRTLGCVYGADRGFASCAMYLFLRALQIDFVIRFKSSLLVGSSDGEMRPAAQLIPKHGRTYSLPSACITSERAAVPQIVLKHAKGMKESWCLATSRADLKPSEVVNLYGRRFTIEERFRDIKDWRFGMGVSAVQMESSQRRDRLLLIIVLAQTLLHILGAAGEALGMSRLLKANTVKSRVHSLYRQGQTYLQLLPSMPEIQSEKLLRRFLELLLQHVKTSNILALL